MALVCPLMEETDHSLLQALTEPFRELSEALIGELKVLSRCHFIAKNRVIP
jgi:hypothetical protein